jgi:chitodextrinase
MPKNTSMRSVSLGKSLVTARLLIAGVLTFVTAVAVLSGNAKIQAAACAVPATDLGSTTVTLNVPVTSTYTVWTRMKAPDVTHNSVNLQIDNNICFNVGGGSFVATSWVPGSGNWIKYQDGVTSSFTTLANLTAGNHTFKYIGTQAGVEVDRVIISSDASCVPVGTGDNCQAGDSTNPTVSQQVLINGQAVTNGQTVSGNVNLTATASDASGIANVEFLIDGTPVNNDTTSPYQYNWNSAGASNQAHTIASRATDTKGNVATTGNITVTVNNAVSCTGNPTTPANLRVVSTTSNSVNLAWDASTAATACALQDYRIYRNGTQVNTATGTTFRDSGLNPGTTYNYAVVAVDTSNHTSDRSTAVPGTTDADTIQPSVPTNLRRTLTTATSVSLAWNVSTDNTGIKDYIIYRNGTQVGTSPTTTFTDPAAAPSTTYNYTVRARDLANNTSAASAVLAVTTLAGTSANKGDVNGSGKVDLTDLSILLAHWGMTGVPVSQGDVNGSGKVDLTDLSILLSNWGKSL